MRRRFPGAAYHYDDTLTSEHNPAIERCEPPEHRPSTMHLADEKLRPSDGRTQDGGEITKPVAHHATS